jgi:hypothetical protein
MKAMIIISAVLMAGATIYGVSDYFTSSRNGSLEKLYKEEAPAPVQQQTFVANTPAITSKIRVVPAANTELVQKEPAAKEEKTVVVKKKKKKVTFSADNFSRARIEEGVPVEAIPAPEIKYPSPVIKPEKTPVAEEKPVPVEVKKPLVEKKRIPAPRVAPKPVPEIKEVPEAPLPVTVEEKVKKLDMSMFSRAPLRKPKIVKADSLVKQ